MATVNKPSITITVYEKGKRAPEYDLENDPYGEKSLEGVLIELKETVIATGKAVLAEEQAKGFDDNPAIFVDGNPKKAVADVLPFGSIEYVAKQDLGPILIEIYTKILKNSPVDTGWYYHNNLVFVNNVEVAQNKQELINYLEKNPNFKSKDTIKFVNTAPYARKLERHAVTSTGNRRRVVNKKKDKRLKGVIYKPNGVYVMTHRWADNKYGKTAFIRFAFLDGGAIPSLTGSNRTYKTDSGVQSRKGKPYFYPCITVSVIGRNITNKG